MRAAVQDVHHRARQQIRGSVRGIARQVFVERQILGSGSGARRRHRNRENRVGAEARLRRRAIELNHFLVERALVRRVEAGHGFGDFAVDVADGFQNALAKVFGLVAVAQLERFMLARGRAGRNRRAPPNSVPGVNVGFNGGIAARIENLAGVDFRDLCGSCSGHGVARLLREMQTNYCNRARSGRS